MNLDDLSTVSGLPHRFREPPGGLVDRPLLARPGRAGDTGRQPASRPAEYLLGLVYVSSATHWLSPAELQRLLERARERNAREGITGVLLYSYGNFMQYLEGPADGVARVYDSIRADTLHSGIIELLREPIRTREFDDWAMGFRDISAFGVSDPPGIDDVFAGESADDAADAPPESAAHMLLSRFWNKGGVRSGL
jgi:hypothetical protein